MALKDMQTVFGTFAKDGKISPDCIKKWFKEAAVIDKDTGITEADLEAAVVKTSKDKKGLDYAEVKDCVSVLAREKEVEPKELMEKLGTVDQMKSVKHGVADAGAKFTKDEKK